MALFLSGALGAQNVASEARAASVVGRVLLSNGNGLPAFALTRGYALNPGDRLDTRGGGQVVIDLNDGSMVLVQPESIVILKDFRAASSLRELFEITLGRVRVKINHFGGRPNPYRMNSPTASIAVRGTEFSVAVDEQGDTQVDVYEGAVEVSSLSDPDRKVLIEAGRGVLVRPGQDFHLLAAFAGGRDPGERGGDAPGGERDRKPLASNVPVPHYGSPVPAPGSQPSAAGSQPAGFPSMTPQDSHPHPPGDHDGELNSPRATAGTYERYIAGLAEIGQTPFLLRFNAFPEAHLDSLENPAYASGFTQTEGRLFFLPSFSGTQASPQATGFMSGGTRPSSYSLSPQFSMFVPVTGSRFVVGGSMASSRVGSDAQSGLLSDEGGLFGPGGNAGRTSSGSSTSNFWSASVVAARRFGEAGNHSFGLEIEKLIGNGSLTNVSQDSDTGQPSVASVQSYSRVSQTRVTAGYSYDFAGHHKLGIFYRYGFIKATDGDTSHVLDGMNLPLDSTRSGGHSAELGMRLRGPLTNRLFYGLDASVVGLSLDDGLVRWEMVDSHQRDRARRAAAGIGLGYLLTRNMILSFDLVGGASRLRATRMENDSGFLLQTGNGDDHFVSTHVAVQTDLTRHLFVNASLLTVWLQRDFGFAVYPDRFGTAALLGDSFFPIPPNPYQPLGRYSDFGVGWRFSNHFFAQYVYSTDYGYSAASHTLMLRYTFRHAE